VQRSGVANNDAKKFAPPMVPIKTGTASGVVNNGVGGFDDRKVVAS